MGFWGPAIFSNDLACDIRGDFRELISEGIEPADATLRILDEYSGCLDDEETTIWLSLAATQSKMGRLQENVKQKALEAIDSGADIQYWRECEASEADIRKREEALLKLRDELIGPQRKPTKVRKVFHDRTAWEIGHAVAYRLLSGRYAVLRVIGIDEQKKYRLAVVELCDYIGDTIPSPSEIEAMPRRQTKWYEERLREARESSSDGLHSFTLENDHKFMIYANSPREFPKERVKVIATGLDVKERLTHGAGATYFGGWKKLDEYLRNAYELE